MLETVTLPLPAGNGYGTAIDVSKLGPNKTVVIDGTLQALISIEISEDGSHWAPVPECTSFPLVGPKTFSFRCVAHYMRAKVAAFAAGGSVAQVGAEADNSNTFISLPVPAGNGPGTPVNVATFGDTWTVVFGAGGPFLGNLQLQISFDGVNFAQILDSFTPSTLSKTATISAAYARVNRVGYDPAQPGPAFLTLGISDVVDETAIDSGFGDVTVYDSGILKQLAVSDVTAQELLELIYRKLCSIDLKLAEAHDLETGNEETFEDNLVS